MGVNVPAERSATSSQIEGAPVAHTASPWPRLALLALLLLAFAHAVILLDAKDLWWDESLSLQRAEENLPDLVRGVLVITDGLSEVPTIDQHPFFSFLLQGALIRLAGDSVFVLRYVSAMAAALFAASTWTWGRWLVRRELAAPSTAWWATLLAAISPFLLWYGQEARPYALWAALALLSTYLLVRATDGERLDIRFLAGFLAIEAAFALTHYYAVFLIALHGLILALYFLRRRLVAGLLLTAGLLLFGAAVGGYAAWTIFSQGGGQNFASISLRILVPDLVNAFSLGLSVDLAVVWPLDLLFGLTALAGAIWSLRSKAAWARGGWILPAALLLPVAIVLLLDRIQPLYMNARHLSLLVGPFLLLTGAGIAQLYRWRAWAGTLLALVFVAGIGYSTVNYHTQELYAKDDYTRLGEYMQGRIMPGDAVLYYPPSSWRIFEYYLPMAPVHAAMAEGAPLAVYGLPLLNRSFDETYAWLRELGKQYDRVWVVKSGTHPYFDLDGAMEGWLRDNFLRVRDAEFFSHSSLRAQLYLPEIPVFEQLPAGVTRPVTAEFGDLIRLAGFDAGTAVAPDLPAQMRLYWQVISKPERRYRYIWSLVEERATGERVTLALVEREPYEGDIPTLYWDPGKTIMEFVEFPPLAEAPADGARRFYTMQVYDAETQEKLPVTRVEGGTIDGDGMTAIFPAEAP